MIYYDVIINDRVFLKLRTIKDIVAVVNRFIIENNLNCYPVTKYIVANWTSRKDLSKKSKRYDWIKVSKIKT